MAATKTCPSCETEVPASVARCKECFHDFTAKPTRSAGPMILLAALALMAVIGAVTFFVVTQRHLDQRILVDGETESIVYITTYRTGPVTERVPWSTIAKLEHVTSAGGRHELAAVGLDGRRWVIKESAGRPLLSDAEHHKHLMSKPLEVIDNTRGFHKTSPPGE